MEMSPDDIAKLGTVIVQNLMKDHIVDEIASRVRGQVPINTLATSSASSSFPAPVTALPIAYENLMMTLLSAELVQPYFSRGVVLVTAGSSYELTGSIPDNEVATIVYKHLMYVDLYTSNFLVTYQSDNNAATLTDVPMTAEVELLGAYLTPVRTQTIHTLTNNDTSTITFSEDTQAALMSSDFYINVWQRLMNAQAQYMNKLVSRIQANGGSF